MNMKWTSIKEKLPRYGEPVLLFSQGIVQTEIFRLCRKVTGEFCWSFENFEEEDGPSISPDDFWMPLPSPPKEWMNG